MASKGLNIEINGADAVIRLLKGLPKEVEDIVSVEIEVGVQDIRTDAMSLIPVDTGRARNSINAESKGMSGEVSVDVEYAGYLEWGTGGEVDVPAGWEEMAEKWRGQGKRTVNMPPRPFLRPAFEKAVPNIVKNIGNEIDRL